MDYKDDPVMSHMADFRPMDLGETSARNYMRDQVSSSAGGRYTYRNGKLIDWMPGRSEDEPIDEYWQFLPIW